MGWGTLQDFTIDQAAGSAALVIGSVGALLTIIWQSRCHCRCNLCYIFQCERRPPPDVEAPAEEDVVAVDAASSDEDEPIVPHVNP
jgi:hypothetical protein|eukprot:COSAG06_NODE_1488_length_9290_cov_4.140899_6_plen_86_part_00